MAVSDQVATQLSHLEGSSTPQSEKPTLYASLLQQILTSSLSSKNITHDLPAYISSLLSDGNLGIIAAEPLLTSAISSISTLQSLSDRITICEAALAPLAEKQSTYSEQDTSLRRILASAYQANDDFSLAARTLEGIPLDSTTTSHKHSDTEKVKHWMTICRLYIEDDDMLSAETYLNKAKTLRHKIPAHQQNDSNTELLLTFQLSQARILDSKRDFLDASTAYHTVSAASILADSDRTAALTQAITTCILSPAGPRRSKQLAKLFADDRAPALPEYPILSKMHLDRLVAPAEVSAFSAALAPHQCATTADGSTVLAKAMVEHNLLAASKLYSNLDFETLAGLLGLDAERAEGYAVRMLEQGRVAGRIDQIGGWVVFEDGGELRRWDGLVGRLVEDVERVASLIIA